MVGVTHDSRRVEGGFAFVAIRGFKRDGTKFAPEAVYWRGVSHYKATNDHTVLGEIAKIFTEKYQDSIWALKSLPWLH